MQQITDWLEKLDMSEYAQRFADERIDFSVLPDLTDQDLKDLGVVLGDRRKILRAIAELDATPATMTPTRKQSSTLSIAALQPLSPTEEASERRHVTVMFCDLVDSTGIAARLDPGEWHSLIRLFLDAASAAVTDLGGTVAKKLDNGLLAMFGYPPTQENDAERAVLVRLSHHVFE
jgi:class 3 adenylate cyclase